VEATTLPAYNYRKGAARTPSGCETNPCGHAHTRGREKTGNIDVLGGNRCSIHPQGRSTLLFDLECDEITFFASIIPVSLLAVLYLPADKGERRED
jgi:hypothetical protein